MSGPVRLELWSQGFLLTVELNTDMKTIEQVIFSLIAKSSPSPIDQKKNAP